MGRIIKYSGWQSIAVLLCVACLHFVVGATAQGAPYYICPADTFTYPAAADGAYYHIDFGDGSRDSSYTPMRHEYTAGQYHLVIARKQNGKTDTVKYHVVAGPLPIPVFSALSSCYLYRFTNPLADSVMVNGGWRWDFGDGAISYDKAPQHLYTSPGQYKVTLQYANSMVCSSSSSRTIRVSSSGDPGFDFHINGTAAIFFPADTLASGYHWDFGDQDTTDSAAPRHVYKAEGKYPVSLSTTSASGCVTYYTDTVATTNAGIQPAIANSNIFQAYPNPFSNTLTIHYALTAIRPVSVKLFDATGKLVATLYSGIQYPGRHDLVIHAPQLNLQPGFYLLYATFGEVYLSQRLIMQQ